MPFDADDMAEFNNADMPGYAEATIAGQPVEGRFRSGYAEALGIGGSTPSFSAATADLTGVSQGTGITIGGAGYTVATIEPDAVSGQTRLRLEKS